jgi:hypothetical protein
MTFPLKAKSEEIEYSEEHFPRPEVGTVREEVKRSPLLPAVICRPASLRHTHHSELQELKCTNSMNMADCFVVGPV